MSRTNDLEKVKELLEIHYLHTTPMDEYFTGMYNGMECVLACLEKREPNYKSCERKGDEDGEVG